MARTITFVDEDGFWWNSDPQPLGGIILLEKELLIAPASTPKLSQRLRMALRILRHARTLQNKTNDGGNHGASE